jgi:hypothetical protein
VSSAEQRRGPGMAVRPATDVAFFRLFLAIFWGENIGELLLKLLLVFCKNVIITLVFEKIAIFSSKIGKKLQKIVIITSIPDAFAKKSP